MNLRKYKIIAGAIALLLVSLLLAIGVYADDELPPVPIDPNQKPISISISSQPKKTLYLVGEELDVSGAGLELKYESGQLLSDVIKTEWCSGFDSKTVGIKTVTVTYPGTDKTASFTVEVVTEDELKIVKPQKLVYFVGDKEDRGGLSVSVVYSNGNTALLESGYTVSGFSSNTIGEKTITVKYKDLKATYRINVIEPALVDISIDKKPNKLFYYIGEELDLTGIKVTAKYENGVVAEITSKIVVNGDISSSGKKTITVVYTERDFIMKESFEVTVTDVQIKSIKFATYPKKTVYTENEVFDQTGISITVTYNNGDVKTVSEDLQFTGFETNTIGKKTITLHYYGYQLNFEVEVIVSASHVHKESEYVQIKAPACTVNGEEATTCLVCFEIVSKRPIPAKGHGAESMPVQTKAPTCTEAGQTATYCMICGDAVTIGDIFPLGHTDGEVQIILAPTCTEIGISKIFCTVCSAEVSVFEIDALGHKFGEWSITLEPMGEAEGKEERSCTVCGFVESNPLPKLEKNLSSGDFSATLNSDDAYFPYLSVFAGEKITDKLTNEEIAALIEGMDIEKYCVIDVFEFVFTNASGEAFNPIGEVTYTVNYALPGTQYASFMIYDGYAVEESENGFSFSVEGSGVFVLVGEMIPEPTETDPETSADDTTEEVTSGSSSDITTDLQVSAPPVKGTSAVVMSLVIIAIILIVIIGALLYTYIFKEYY